MRPHTLITPKPLLPVAGKPIVQHLVEDLARMTTDTITEVAYVIGDFGPEVEQQLQSIAGDIGAKGSIWYQTEPLGTAHAILCAADVMDGPVIVAFADTLFRSNFRITPDMEGVIWVEQVDDPRQFGVVKYSEDNIITDFVEKPQEFVSDKAIIGIYYVKDGAYLRNELQYLIDNDIRDKGEYQLTNALEHMKGKGTRFRIGAVEEWLDCGNYRATVYTNQRVLEFIGGDGFVAPDARILHSVIVPPCYIGPQVTIENSVIGPHVSIGQGCRVKDSVVRNSIVGEQSTIESRLMADSMIGAHAHLKGRFEDLSLGDYSTENHND